MHNSNGCRFIKKKKKNHGLWTFVAAMEIFKTKSKDVSLIR